MPILDVEVVMRHGEALPAGLAADLADALGEVFAADPGELWVRLRDIPADRYAENEEGEDRPFPVFVTVREGSPPVGALLEARVAHITECVARLADRPPENVHVIVEPGLRGRVALGGRLVR